MTESDRLLMEEKFKNVNDKIDNNQTILIQKLDAAIEISKKALIKAETVEEQTSVWRWFQRKPRRFAIIVLVIYLTSIPEVRQSVINIFKGL